MISPVKYFYAFARVKRYCLLLVLFGFAWLNSFSVEIANERERIIVSTDIGGTDFDDYQSMVHLLVYSDTFDIEGIISSPYGKGGVGHILEAIDAYKEDYPNLAKHSDNYPLPDNLRDLVKQGATEVAGLKGFGESTEGSKWIIECARKDDSRPLNILIWGGIEDLAQALHDAPDILPRLRVYFIGGPNKKWSVNAYQYIVENHPELWIIEANATYRGWFEGGIQDGEWSNTGFVETHVKDHGALGEYFYAKGRTLKMGDTPSLMYFLSNNPNDPSSSGWGGSFVRAWTRPHKIYKRMTTLSDSIEEFGVLELHLPFKEVVSAPYSKMNIENQSLPGEVDRNTVRFLFSPKRSGNWDYALESNIASLNGQTGQLVSFTAPSERKENPSAKYRNWWTDDPSSGLMENGHIGIKTINRYRKEFLKDFAERMKRCSPISR